MTDPWGTPDPNALPTPAAVPPGYGTPSYGTPPPGYGTPPPGHGAAPGSGPVGRVRPTGTSILLFVVTLGVYGLVYNYKVHSEMQRHSGRGVGGGVALVLTFVAGVAMPFVTPAEVGSLYSQRGEKAPVSGWTGLWLVVSAVVGYVVFIVAVVAAAATTSGTADGSSDVSAGTAAGLVVAGLVGSGLYVAGAVIWFVKTNGALNRYWQSLGTAA